jgi:dipeptidyl aminopeptidase/acylaminoacyl peptidase
MRQNGIPVTYVLFEDEGHGFANPANSIRFFAAAETFLGEALGGRVEPPNADEEIGPYLR